MRRRRIQRRRPTRPASRCLRPLIDERSDRAARGLRVLGHHGALEGEQDTAQPFEVDLDVEAALDEAARNDELGRTVDYGLVVETARSIVAERRFRLLEALAGTIADGVLEIPRSRRSR